MNALERLVEQVRVGVGGGAEHDAHRARRQRAPDRRDRAQAAAAARTGTSSSRAIRSRWSQVHRLALARAVEVHHVQEVARRPPRTSAPPRAGRRRRRSRRRSRPWRSRTALPSRMSTAGSRIMRRRARTKFLSSRSPSGPDFSGWNWTPYTRRLLDRAHELACRTRRCRAPRRRRRAAARTSARGRRRTGPAGPRSAALSRRQRTGFQPICGTLRPGASSASTGPRSRPIPSAPPSSVVRLEQQLHAQAEPDHGHARLARARAAARRAPSSRTRSIAFGIAPTPGSTIAVAPRARARGRAVSSGSAPTCSSALLDRAQVAHAVVEDRDARQQERPWSRARPSTRSIARDRLRAARARTP